LIIWLTFLKNNWIIMIKTLRNQIKKVYFEKIEKEITKIVGEIGIKSFKK